MPAMPSIPGLLVRTDCNSRRLWHALISLVYYIGLILFLLVSLYVAVRSSTYRAVGILLVCVAVLLEMALWQFRCSAAHRMEDGGDNVLEQLYAHERPRDTNPSSYSVDPADKMGLKRDPLATMTTCTGDEAEEMVRMVMHSHDERLAIEDIVRPLLSNSPREDPTFAPHYHRLR